MIYAATLRICLLVSGVCIASLAYSTTAHAVDFDNTDGFDFATVTHGQELGCLAMNIYHEGRGESAKGRAAIASVTMNRVRSSRYPDTVCEVVWQRKQFSWTNVAPRHHAITNRRAWHQALVIAELFIGGAMASEVGEATHYHTVHVQPSWQDETKQVALVGDHIFYAL